MFKVNNRNTRTSGDICAKLTMKTSEGRQWRSSDVFIVDFEYVSIVIVEYVSIVNFEQVNAGWVSSDIFRTLSNINDGDFLQKNLTTESR